MKVLVADKFEKSGQEGIVGLGCELICNPDLKEDALTSAINELKPDVLIVRSTKVTAPMITAGSLKLIIRAGSGYNTIDVETATKHNVNVANCPGLNAIAVAELAFGLIIGLDRRIPENVQLLREGKWNKKEFSKANGICGSTLGLIGVGHIGNAMIPRAKAFGMKVIAWSRSLTPEKAQGMGIEYRANPKDVCAESDVVSVHVALKPETKELMNDELFGAMKDGAIIINTSRAEVVNQNALISAVKNKGIRAGLDVFEGEPAVSEGEIKTELAELPNVYATHHIGASTNQAQEAVASETVRIIKEFKEKGVVPNLVNPR